MGYLLILKEKIKGFEYLECKVLLIVFCIIITVGDYDNFFNRTVLGICSGLMLLTSLLFSLKNRRQLFVFIPFAFVSLIISLIFISAEIPMYEVKDYVVFNLILESVFSFNVLLQLAYYKMQNLKLYFITALLPIPFLLAVFLFKPDVRVLYIVVLISCLSLFTALCGSLSSLRKLNSFFNKVSRSTYKKFADAEQEYINAVCKNWDAEEDLYM